MYRLTGYQSGIRIEPICIMENIEILFAVSYFKDSEQIKDTFTCKILTQKFNVLYIVHLWCSVAQGIILS